MKSSLSLLLAIFVTILVLAPAKAQNLVANGDFEVINAHPTAQGQITRAEQWRNCNGQTAFPYATPDLFTAGGSSGLQWPNTFAATVVPQSGNALAGFITSNFFVPDFREYVSYPLSSPLVPGETYTISFWLTNGTANWYGCRGSNNIGAAFTVGAPVQLQHEPLALTPQIEITTVVHHTSWQQYSFTYMATAPFTHITLGNFRNDLATTIGVFTSGSGLAYYFIDNVEARLGLPLPAEELALAQVEDESAMSLSWHLPEDAAGDEIALERSLDQSTFIQVEDFGKVTQPGTDVGYVDAQALAGMQYYYRLRELSPNGDLRYSPVIAARFGKGGDFVAGQLYPNPVRDRFFLEFTALVDGELELQLMDGAGRLVHEASQSLGIGQPTMAFDLPEGLATGIYQAHFNFRGQQFTKKIMVAPMI